MQPPTRPELRGTFAMVASTHWLASATGMAVLERGGNAFDAAVAAGLVLQVVEPHLNGPGGDLPAILWPAGAPEPVVLCAQGPAPAAATIAYYRDELGLALVPGTGPLAAVVPGAFGGWMAMLRDYGSLRLRDVVEFAIGYAANGFPVLERVASTLAAMEQRFVEQWPTSAEVYLPVPAAGSLARNRALAATYQRVVDSAERSSPDRAGQAQAALDTWYRGWVAEAMVGFQARAWADTTGEPHRGLISEADLAGWQPAYERPYSVGYGGVEVFKAGPWSQGPVFLQQLRLLGNFDVAGMAPGSARSIHTITECAKLAFADREAWYGDPLFVDVPMEGLLSAGYAAQRATLVTDKCADELVPGSPEGRKPRLPKWPPAGGERSEFRGDTVHLDVVDGHGNMVSATPSGGWLTGAPVVPELGFCLGTRAQMFWLEEGLPSSLRPGQRPRTTLSPTMVGRDGSAYLALGTPGGDQQDQWALHAFLAHVAHGMDLQQAIDSVNHHTEAFPGSFYPRGARPRHLAVEGRGNGEVLDDLRRRGHHVESAPAWGLGRVSMVGRAADGVLMAAADPRGRQGYACGR